jgi:hypothetical protein
MKTNRSNKMITLHIQEECGDRKYQVPPEHWMYDELFNCGETLEREFEETLDLHDWTRLREVEAFAEGQGIDRAEAIKRLVNHGLSFPY